MPATYTSVIPLLASMFLSVACLYKRSECEFSLDEQSFLGPSIVCLPPSIFIDHFLCLALDYVAPSG